MKKDEKGVMQQVNIKIPDKEYKQLRIISIYSGMPFQDFINNAIRRELYIYEKQIPEINILKAKIEEVVTNKLKDNNVWLEEGYNKDGRKLPRKKRQNKHIK